ncbi:MAG: glycosyltransferase family 4 protein [Planctomycetaceae bacterium]|nr:glycosyltransferase family 4 protein [Planctomycetaceae bacterium]MBT6484734.1 glycosyltransferase family 4 protein [Planctomycetaceae bacterium]MBT6496484.1 glycosyltransferase family 4 protein [Planctomycetaceae bacterium]
MLNILQVCNVGRIVGGTAACAWTVTRSLPACRHTVAFLGPVIDETRQAFSHCRLLEWKRVTAANVADIKPDVVLLHNTSFARCDIRLPAVTLLDRHSTTKPASADLTLYCSRWLAEQCGRKMEQVCLQAVPRPLDPAANGETRSLRDEIVIGRICTPVENKWPAEIIEFYGELAGRFPSVRWEFIGCPSRLQLKLQVACGGRATFLSASWEARSRLWQWDALLYHSPTVTESFGRTVAEAMRAGCIPIVDNRGGFREQITSGCGYLCRNQQDFAQAIAELQSSAHRWKTSHACRAHADETFSLKRFGTELLRRFQEATT